MAAVGWLRWILARMFIFSVAAMAADMIGVTTCMIIAIAVLSVIRQRMPVAGGTIAEATIEPLTNDIFTL